MALGRHDMLFRSSPDSISPSCLEFEQMANILNQTNSKRPRTTQPPHPPPPPPQEIQIPCGFIVFGMSSDDALETFVITLCRKIS